MCFSYKLIIFLWTLIIFFQISSNNFVSAHDPAFYKILEESGDGQNLEDTASVQVQNQNDQQQQQEEDDFSENDLNDNDSENDSNEEDFDFLNNLDENEDRHSVPATAHRLASPPPVLNQRPIIGVLVHKYVAANVHDGRWDCADKEGKHHSYVPSSIIRFIEAGGARTVPIRANGDHEYLAEMFRSVNGIYYPGAETGIHHSEYATAGKFLYRLAVKANDAGTYFPLWGECLGLQFLLMTAANFKGVFKTSCDSLDTSYAMNFTQGANQSRLYGQMPASLITAMEQNALTSHNHQYCVKVEIFEKFQFLQPFRILSTNYEPTSNTTFVSSAEAIDYPFYALGFHPESNMYVWGEQYDINHSPEAIEMAQFFLRFLANEARKNGHKFRSASAERRSLMKNTRLACDGDIYFIPR